MCSTKGENLSMLEQRFWPEQVTNAKQHDALQDVAVPDDTAQMQGAKSRGAHPSGGMLVRVLRSVAMNLSLALTCACSCAVCCSCIISTQGLVAILPPKYYDSELMAFMHVHCRNVLGMCFA